jgi:thymidylate kinase
MKLIIIESGDQLGKNSLIEGLCKHFNYDNITIRHFGKPPTNLTSEETLDYQFNCFYNEGNFVQSIRDRFKKYDYYNETIIWNRSHLGEYVYGQMFRNADPNFLKTKLLFFEKHFLDFENIYLILLTADPEFFLGKEDGNSFSKTLIEKTKELELFNEAFEFSLIENKLHYKVNYENGKFRKKQEILNDVINFIK